MYTSTLLTVNKFSCTGKTFFSLNCIFFPFSMWIPTPNNITDVLKFNIRHCDGSSGDLFSFYKLQDVVHCGKYQKIDFWLIEKYFISSSCCVLISFGNSHFTSHIAVYVVTLNRTDGEKFIYFFGKKKKLIGILVE